MYQKVYPEATRAQAKKLKRRDSVEDRIDKSLSSHLKEQLSLSTNSIKVSEETERTTSSRRIRIELKEFYHLQDNLFQKLENQKLICKILLTLSFFRRVGYITKEEHGLLKDITFDENDVQINGGIIAGAIELLILDHDIDECIDTIDKVIRTIYDNDPSKDE